MFGDSATVGSADVRETVAWQRVIVEPYTVELQPPRPDIADRYYIAPQWCSFQLSMPAGFRRHVCDCDIAQIRFVGKLVIIQTFSYTNGLNII